MRQQRSARPSTPTRRTLGAGLALAAVVLGALTFAITGSNPPAPPPSAAVRPSPSRPVAIEPGDSLADGANPGSPPPVLASLPPVSVLATMCAGPTASATGSVTSSDGSVRPGGGQFALHVPVLMYHRIVLPSLAADSLPGLVVPPAVFAAQMDALAGAGWHTITLAALSGDLAHRVAPPARTFVVTFDDGWPDGYTNAWPILQAHGFVATFFIIPGRIGESDQLSVAQIQALAAAGNEIGNHTMDHADLARLSGARLTYEIDGASARIAAVAGRPPVSLAYPFGAVNAGAVQAVESCHELAMAVTTQPGVRETWTTRFAVPRLRVGPSTTPARLLAMLEPYR